MKISPYLKVLAEKNGSDLYLSTGAVPSAKFHGSMTALSKQAAPPGWVKELAYEIMNEQQQKDFETKPEMNLALSEPGIGRFRERV